MANVIAKAVVAPVKHWYFPYLSPSPDEDNLGVALIILNQPFSEQLLKHLWSSSSWHSCADGGANRLYDIFQDDKQRNSQDETLLPCLTHACGFLPDLIVGDLDSIRSDVKSYYANVGVTIVQDPDQNSTDLQKCLFSLAKIEIPSPQKYTVLLLGGLSGRLDQTIHTLSLLHRLRDTRDRIYAITDENVGWVLDSGEHLIEMDPNKMGPTCGLLPVGIDKAVISTVGLEWNLTETESSFDGLISTSNHVVAPQVWIKTTKPIWWCVEVRNL